MKNRQLAICDILAASLASLPPSKLGRGCTPALARFLVSGMAESEDVTCQVHVRTIALALGVSRDTVRDALRRLVDNGVITIEYRAGIVGPRTDPMQSASIYHMGPALAAALSKQLDHLQSLRVAREE